MFGRFPIAINSLVCILAKQEGSFFREPRTSGKTTLGRVQVSEMVAYEAILEGSFSSICWLDLRQYLIVTTSYCELSDR